MNTKELNDNTKPVDKTECCGHIVIPLNEINENNITMEVLSCMGALGGYFQAGIPINIIKPLIQRIALLQYWEHVGIDHRQIELFEADKYKFIRDVIRPSTV